jgi:hypothetical protein
MNKRIYLIALTALLGLTAIGRALDWEACLRYLHPEADPETAWVVQDDSDGKGPHLAKWNLPGAAPTMAQLQAVEATAVAWKQARELDRKTDVRQWDNEQLRLAVMLLLDEINTLRAKLGLPLRTLDDLKQAAQAKVTPK